MAPHYAILSLGLSSISKIWLDRSESREQFLRLLIADWHGNNDILLGL